MNDGMSLDCDIRFDLKSISSHARRGCCSQPGASLEIDFKSLKGGSRELKSILSVFFGAFSKGNLKLNLSLPHQPQWY